jgi:hypothetical protein
LLESVLGSLLQRLERRAGEERLDQGKAALDRARSINLAMVDLPLGDQIANRL